MSDNGNELNKSHVEHVYDTCDHLANQLQEENPEMLREINEGFMRFAETRFGMRRPADGEPHGSDDESDPERGRPVDEDGSLQN